MRSDPAPAAPLDRLARELSSDPPASLPVIRALRRRGPVVLLETTRPSADHGGATILAGDPLAVWSWNRGVGEVRALREEGRDLESVPTDGASAFHALQSILDRSGNPSIGAYGFFSYECGADPAIPRLEPFPDAWFLLTDTVIRTENSPKPLDATPDPRLAPPTLLLDLALDSYRVAFHRARASLETGDSYQICYTYPIEASFTGDPLDLYDRLRRENPAPFAAYVEGPFGAIVSSSPERLVRVDADGNVEARPMKGTARRPSDAVERSGAARALETSAKDRAENLMIADLLRNDLGRVCRIGSVRVARPAHVEDHTSLLQLVSVVEGRLAENRSRADLLASVFPPGSMTGAPKIRSIDILREIESAPRGPYAGALGYWMPDGRLDFAVVIRTILVSRRRARLNVGGGIVWDSTAEGEYAESRAKAEPLFRALAAAASDGNRR